MYRSICTYCLLFNNEQSFYSFVSFCYLPILSQFDLNTSGVMFSFFIYLLYLSRNVFMNISKERSLEITTLFQKLNRDLSENLPPGYILWYWAKINSLISFTSHRDSVIWVQ